MMAVDAVIDPMRTFLIVYVNIAATALIVHRTEATGVAAPASRCAQGADQIDMTEPVAAGVKATTATALRVGPLVQTKLKQKGLPHDTAQNSPEYFE